ncbi:MAG: CopG family transcriptional regulator [Spirochaeta sp. LUC14_002_19_P3]|nr:MAG: CopG family transcriptional regulator [Spirochaeta sp. LUC14_002_19_P3]
MESVPRRSTVYFDPDIYKALKIKSATTNTSISESVNDAVRAALQDDYEDLNTFRARSREAVMSYEELLADLAAHGKI